MSSRPIHHRNGTTKGRDVRTVSRVVISFCFRHLACHVYGDRWLSLCNVIVTAINRNGRKTHRTRPAEARRPSLVQTLLWVSEIGLLLKWIWQGSKGQRCETNATEEVERFIKARVWFWGLYKRTRDWSYKSSLFLLVTILNIILWAAICNSSVILERFVNAGEQVDCVSATTVICIYEYQMLRVVVKNTTQRTMLNWQKVTIGQNAVIVR